MVPVSVVIVTMVRAGARRIRLLQRPSLARRQRLLHRRPIRQIHADPRGLQLHHRPHPDSPHNHRIDIVTRQRTQWLGLDVKRHRITGADTAEVEFVARYRVGGGSAVRMAEHSRFVREDGRWYYLDAVD